MIVSQPAKDILALSDEWGTVPWPLIPADVIASAEKYAKAGVKRPKLRAKTREDRKEMATKKAALRAQGLMVG